MTSLQNGNVVIRVVSGYLVLDFISAQNQLSAKTSAVSSMFVFSSLKIHLFQVFYLYGNKIYACYRKGKYPHSSVHLILLGIIHFAQHPSP